VSLKSFLETSLLRLAQWRSEHAQSAGCSSCGAEQPSISRAPSRSSAEIARAPTALVEGALRMAVLASVEASWRMVRAHQVFSTANTSWVFFRSCHGIKRFFVPFAERKVWSLSRTQKHHAGSMHRNLTGGNGRCTLEKKRQKACFFCLKRLYWDLEAY
jgi:hypothetical protein